MHPCVLAGLTIAAAAQANPAHNMMSSACEEKRQQALGRLLSDSAEKPFGMPRALAVSRFWSRLRMKAGIDMRPRLQIDEGDKCLNILHQV
jgi:hypothetical protein